MIKIFIPVIMFLLAYNISAQSGGKILSPPKELNTRIDGAQITVKYNAPSARDRTIFGDAGLVPYNAIWRTGANEATTISISDDLFIEGSSLKKGTYSLFTIPGQDKWIIIFNKVIKQWGAYNYDEKEDALRVNVVARQKDQHTETLEIGKKDHEILIKWEMLEIPVKISAQQEKNK